MKITTSYKQRITDHQHNKVLKDTVMYYSNVVRYLLDVVNTEWNNIKELNSKQSLNYIEKLIHTTSKNPNPKYDFDIKLNTYNPNNTYNPHVVRMLKTAYRNSNVYDCPCDDVTYFKTEPMKFTHDIKLNIL